MIGAAEERPVFFDAAGTQLAGVLTMPPAPNGRVVLMPWGTAAYPSSGRNRVRTTLDAVLS